jgi:hypothetical protein
MLTAAPLVLLLAAAPATAEDNGKSDLQEGMDLLSQGTRLLLEGLMKEFEPALRDLEEAIGDLNAYHPPEILPNGDIIIRRKEPLPVEPETGEDGEVEL